jgi:nucleotide-binding universal stress UspA family protein
MFKHILFATDGSAASEHAAQLAVGLARVHGARLTALYVVDPYPYLGVGEANPLGFQAYVSAALQHAAAAHNKVAAMCEQAPAVAFQARLAEDVGASVGIVQSAKDVGADLIVVGSHGRTGVARLMLGSVASKVVAESAIPVLVAR